MQRMFRRRSMIRRLMVLAFLTTLFYQSQAATASTREVLLQAEYHRQPGKRVVGSDDVGTYHTFAIPSNLEIKTGASFGAVGELRFSDGSSWQSCRYGHQGIFSHLRSWVEKEASRKLPLIGCNEISLESEHTAKEFQLVALRSGFLPLRLKLAVKFKVTPLPLISVPDISGLTKEDAALALTNAELTLGNITYAHYTNVPKDFVVTQTPVPGTEVLKYSSVDVVISLGPQPVPVPDITGLYLFEAQSELAALGLALGAIEGSYDNQIAKDLIISQMPDVGSEALPGEAVSVVVSLGPDLVAVPNLIGKEIGVAEPILVAARLQLGALSEAFSDDIPSGQIMHQVPGEGALVLARSEVSITVSKGPEPIAVPNVVGLDQEIASSQILAANLMVGNVTLEYDEDAPTGQVTAQSPVAGSLTLPQSQIDLTVSKGPRPVPVPNLVGLQENTIAGILSEHRLTLGSTTREYSASIPLGEVLGQDPPAGSLVPPQYTVSITVSKGPEQTLVPNVSGISVTEAEAIINDANLLLGNVSTDYSSEVPKDTIIAQSPMAGAEVDTQSSVHLVVSLGPKMIVVPDLTGHTILEIGPLLEQAELILGSTTEQFSSDVPVGLVISQEPVSGSIVAVRSAVSITISKGIETTIVPDVVGLLQEEAEASLQAANLSLGGTVLEYSDSVPTGHVIGQEPEFGSEVPVATQVSLTLSRGPSVTTFVMPNLLGMTQDGAKAEMDQLGAVTFWEFRVDNTAVSRFIEDQIPAPGETVTTGEAVLLFVVLPSDHVVVPDVAGLERFDAELLVHQHALFHTVKYENSTVVPPGHVISQNPLAGANAKFRDTVELTISRPSDTVIMPDMSGLAADDAEILLRDLGLQYILRIPEPSSAPAGTVVATYPPPDTEVTASYDVIELYVAEEIHMVQVPDFVGMDVRVVVEELPNHELTLGGVETVESDEPQGNILAQTPTPDSTVPALSPIYFTVSIGRKVEIPDLTGVGIAEAESIITELGLKPHRVLVSRQGPDYGKVVDQSLVGLVVVDKTFNTVKLAVGALNLPSMVGQHYGVVTFASQIFQANAEIVEVESDSRTLTVITQDPPAGTLVLPGFSLRVEVSFGKSQIVPSISGIPEWQGLTLLKTAGFQVGSYKLEASQDILPGRIIRQIPEGGTVFPVGKAIAIIVSAGPDIASQDTIEGYDANGDKIRDDLEEFLEETFPSSEELVPARDLMVAYNQALQQNPVDENSLLSFLIKKTCFSEAISDRWDNFWSLLTDLHLNSRTRLLADIRLQRATTRSLMDSAYEQIKTDGCPTPMSH